MAAQRENTLVYPLLVSHFLGILFFFILVFFYVDVQKALIENEQQEVQAKAQYFANELMLSHSGIDKAHIGGWIKKVNISNLAQIQLFDDQGHLVGESIKPYKDQNQWSAFLDDQVEEGIETVYQIYYNLLRLAPGRDHFSQITELPGISLLTAGKETYNSIWLDYDQTFILTSDVPIKKGDKVIGSLRYLYLDDQIEGVIHNLKSSMIEMFFISIVFVFALSYFASWYIRKHCDK